MAEHKVVNVTQLDSDLTSIANAIRNRAGTSAKIEFPTGFVNMIRSIPVNMEVGEEIEVENLSQVHYWTKTGMVGGTINEAYKSDGTTIGYMNETVQYADEVVLEGNNLALVNPKTYTVTSDDDAAEEVLVGKYIYTLSKFYRIPSDARIIYNAPSQYTKAFLRATTVYELSVTAGSEEQTTIIVSDDITAYPENGEQDGFTYVYQGIVGVAFPNLTNPGSASDLTKGKQLIDADGNVVTGTHECEGGVTLPELGDIAAQPTDMVVGKVLYDDKGNPVTGTLIVADEINEALFGASDFTFGGTPGGTTFSVKGAYAGNTDGVVVRIGAGLGVRNAPTEFFGDARPEDVTKGKKFTSAAGLLVEGTHEDEGGVELPELTNPASASDMALDKQLIDQDGNVVTGTLFVFAEGENFMQSSNVKLSVGQMLVAQVLFSPQSGVEGAILRPGANVVLRAPAENLGNATANQVAKGATFTSANGILIPGALPDGGMVRLADGNAYSYMALGGGSGILLEAIADADRIIRAGDEVGVIATYDKFGDATSADVVKGKKFTSAEGLFVEGELVEVLTGQAVSATDNPTVMWTTDGGIRIKAQTNHGIDLAVRDGAYLIAAATGDQFGDASAADVVKGKTFTSASGLLVEGGLEVQTFTVTDDGAGNVTITSSAITDNNGNIVIE